MLPPRWPRQGVNAPCRSPRVRLGGPGRSAGRAWPQTAGQIAMKQMSADIAAVEEAWIECITEVLRQQRREQQGGRLGPVVHDELAGLACVVEVHDDEVVNLNSGRVVGLQEEIAAHAVEAEVLKRVEAPRETQHPPDLLRTTPLNTAP